VKVPSEGDGFTHVIHPGPAHLVRIVQWDEGTSQIYHPSSQVLANLKPPQTVGRLLRSNTLWTQALPSTTGAEADFFKADLLP